ncbi:hypothetical protein SAMN04488056_103438 [Cohaesibacter marisflavi]|uniref:Uncharacterized protein n=1 Tax=Cohaesibacter marisflavi TaxID=655353 RepID=A0A1I5F0Y5_9HYPH|nr:hypothetical protein SAMN04488056_103438 [Cohaesibacter marisflavi]
MPLIQIWAGCSRRKVFFVFLFSNWCRFWLACCQGLLAVRSHHPVAKGFGPLWDLREFSSLHSLKMAML